jgi:hypothetical protein
VIRTLNPTLSATATEIEGGTIRIIQTLRRTTTWDQEIRITLATHLIKTIASSVETDSRFFSQRRTKRHSRRKWQRVHGPNTARSDRERFKCFNMEKPLDKRHCTEADLVNMSMTLTGGQNRYGLPVQNLSAHLVDYAASLGRACCGQSKRNS